ncbi:MAG TPA: SpoIIE family protein phosphatase [Cellvibrionaceae bacterium]|nr:SpoIIE family protein phosphatase [Cellvibrionaceae bacterium]
MKALVVDDNAFNRDILSYILEDAGHQVVQANDGSEACHIFERQTDIEFILMDVNMPVMDGFEATQIIRAMAGDKPVSIIFVTAWDNPDITVKCLEVGGDDFVPKPINEQILLSKIKAHQRSQSLYLNLKRTNEDLLYHQCMVEREHKIVEHVFAQCAQRQTTFCKNVQQHSSPSSMFNGDLVLTAPAPNGGVYVLAGDFTGHGLSAAIGSLPVTEIFYDYARRQRSIAQMAREINKRLHTLLPIGMFFCCTLLFIDPQGQQCMVWSGGMNDLVVCPEGNSNLQFLQAAHMPLGILEDEEFDDLIHIHEFGLGARLYIYTDGINEATDSAGQVLGHEPVWAVIRQGKVGQTLDKIVELVKTFEGDTTQHDDFTLVEVLFTPLIHVDKTTHEPVDIAAEHLRVSSFPWRLTARLNADDMRRTDMIQQILAFIGTIQGVELHKDKLFLIASELYNNALEHGVLKLSSELKNTVGGFGEYYKQRSERLASLESGYIDVDFTFVRGDPNEVHMVVSNSGEGFHFRQYFPKEPDGDTHAGQNHGRGIKLLRQLCKSLDFDNGGCTAKAIYQFQ